MISVSPTSIYQASQPEVKKARGDVPDILPEAEPEPTVQTSDFENSYNYVCECQPLIQCLIRNCIFVIFPIFVLFLTTYYIPLHSV